MKKSHALKLRLLGPLMLALAALAGATHLGLQASRSSLPTSSDMRDGASSESWNVALRSPAAPLPSPLGPSEEGVRLEALSDGLALPHEHLSRVNHLARAGTLRELGDLSGALTECRRALHDAPEDEEALRTLARLGRLTGRTELAVLAFERLGRLQPEDASPLVQQARLLLSLGRHGDATRVGAEAITRDPEDAEAYHVLGRAHLAAGNLPEAIVRFQQAVHLDPEHGHALNNLGLAWLRANENARAAEVLTRAAALLPHVAYVHNNLGVACERLGRTEEAQAAYATATRLSPRYVQARINTERMNRLARLDVPSPGLGGDMPPGSSSEDATP
jgi:Flp pilus assembly protein TadD